MSESEIKQFIKRIGDLSTTPALMGKILALMKDESASIDDIAEIVSHDLAMAGRLLRVANSAFFAHSGQIKDIHQAIFFLGLNRVRTIITGMSVLNMFSSSAAFQIAGLWMHSYEVAYLSGILSEKVAITQPQESFLAGLMHDIGRLVLLQFDQARFLKIETTDAMFEQEQELFGCTHVQAGAWFAEEIGLPNSIVIAIKYHHKPSQAPDEMHVVSIVSLAEALTRMFSPRLEDDGIWTNEHDAILLEFGLTSHELTLLQENFKEIQSEVQGFFAS